MVERKEVHVDVEGRTLTLVNLDKVMYPRTGTTKAEVLQAFEDFQKGRMGQIPAVHGLSNDPADTVEG